MDLNNHEAFFDSKELFILSLFCMKYPFFNTKHQCIVLSAKRQETYKRIFAPASTWNK